MSERVASCGSLYDSTNLLLQYCNNGELPLIPLHHTQQGKIKNTAVQTAAQLSNFIQKNRENKQTCFCILLEDVLKYISKISEEMLKIFSVF